MSAIDDIMDGEVIAKEEKGDTVIFTIRTKSGEIKNATLWYSDKKTREKADRLLHEAGSKKAT